MTIRIVEVEVVVVTADGRFSGKAKFAPGLGLVRADNNMGKTTMLMGVLYALGLEGMLGPGAQQPMKPAVLSEIRDDLGTSHPVVESWVIVELENGDRSRLTLQRSIASPSENSSLVHSWDGPALTDPSGEWPSRDFYVRLPGAATRDAGLHRRLAEFIGWELPQVTRWNGGTSPLYMEILFSFVFVEQTRGWSGIGATLPRYLQIRDPDRRAIEFLLGLDALTRSEDREHVRGQLSEVKAEWRAAAETFSARVADLGGRVEGLPRNPPAAWPAQVPMSVQLSRNSEWSGLHATLSELRDHYRSLDAAVPEAEALATSASSELAEAEARVSRLSAFYAMASQDLQEQRSELSALDERILALREDRARYADAIRLSKLGSVEQLAVATSRCPTCDQGLPHTLFGSDLRPVMSLEDNKELLDAELQTFAAMREDAETVADASSLRRDALRRDLTDARASVRGLKATLTQHSRAPARAVIEDQVRTRQRIEDLEKIETSLATLDERLAPLASRHLALVTRLQDLEGGMLSASDNAKLDALERSICEQLDAYGFSSVPPREIRLGRDSYMPQRDDRPIAGKDISASDNVRLVWAYLVGLLEVSREFDTRHPGLLVLDEPGQQEVSDESIAALFARLDLSRSAGQQIIVGTSKDETTLAGLLEGTQPVLNSFGAHTLTLRDDATGSPSAD